MLMAAARALQPPLWAATTETVIGLLAVTGMFSRGRLLESDPELHMSAGGRRVVGCLTIATAVVHVPALGFMSLVVER